jgi:hypothetical protein
MVQGDGLSSIVASSRGSTSRELEQLVIDSGSLSIQRVLHVGVHGVSWWLVSVPRPSQGRRLHRDTFIKRTFYTLGQACCQGSGGPDGVRSSRLHEVRARRAGAERPVGGEHAHHVAVELVVGRHGRVCLERGVGGTGVAGGAVAAAAAAGVAVLLVLLHVAGGGGAVHRVGQGRGLVERGAEGCREQVARGEGGGGWRPRGLAAESILWLWSPVGLASSEHRAWRRRGLRLI